MNNDHLPLLIESCITVYSILVFMTVRFYRVSIYDIVQWG